MENNILETTFEFGGFYNSMHDYILDDFISVYYSEDCETPALNYDEALDSIDYKKLRKFYCDELINFMNNKIGMNLSVQKLWSPTYYNFETDRIEISFDETDVQKLCNYLLESLDVEVYRLNELVQELFKEWTTRRDGFIPFNTYSDICDDIEYKMMALLEIFADNNLNCEDDFYYDWYDYIDDALWGLDVQSDYGFIEPIFEDSEDN